MSWPLLLKSLLTFGTRPHHWRAGTRRYVASPAAAVAAAEAGPEAAGAVALARDARRELGILVEGARRFEAARTARPQGSVKEQYKKACEVQLGSVCYTVPPLYWVLGYLLGPRGDGAVSETRFRRCYLPVKQCCRPRPSARWP